MITTSFFQIYSFYTTGSELGTRKQHFELRAFSGFCIRIFPILLTCLLQKECQLTISGIVNCSVWFVDIYDPKRIFQKILIELQRPQFYMWNVHIKYDHVWEVTILCSVTHQNLFYLCYIAYDTQWRRWIT